MEFFCPEFKYVISFYYQARFLSDLFLNIEENLYLLFLTESIGLYIA
jgi:hypothetical protein